jgi:hypothetical protein
VLAIRLLLVAVAVAVCGWFILGVRAAHDQQRVAALVQRSGPVTSAEASGALRSLDHAGTLNPDRELDILRAQVLLRVGDYAREARILKDIVASEPRNLDAWVVLAFVPPPNPYAPIARARGMELAPPVPSPR